MLNKTLCEKNFIERNWTWGHKCKIKCFSHKFSIDVKVNCHILNIKFMIKCKVQGPMRSKECVQVWNILLQIGKSAKDGAQWLLSALPFWELRLCKSPKCSKPWLKRQIIIKLGPQNTIGKVLKCSCLSALALFIET
jgi:hypothetical protein